MNLKTASVLTLVMVFTVSLLLVNVTQSVLASKDDNNGSNGCERVNPNSKVCEKNPNSITNTCDPNGDGIIDRGELAEYLASHGIGSDTLAVATTLVEKSETLAGSRPNGVIDTSAELDVLNNRYLSSYHISPCPAL